MSQAKRPLAPYTHSLWRRLFSRRKVLEEDSALCLAGKRKIVVKILALFPIPYIISKNMTTASTATDQRMRSVSSDGREGGSTSNNPPFLACPSETVEKQITVRGSVGTYSGCVNSKGLPHGEGSFFRDGLTYVGVWKVSGASVIFAMRRRNEFSFVLCHSTLQDGERIGEGGYYATNGRLVGNVVWD